MAKLTPEERRRRDAELEAKRRHADEVFARARAKIEARRRADEERLERRRRFLRRLNPFRRVA